MYTKVLVPFLLICSLIGFFIIRGYTDNASSIGLYHDSFDRIVSNGKMNVCYVSRPPSVIKNPETGNLSGFMIDVMNRISTDAGITIQYVETTRGGFAADLNVGKCDMGLFFYPLLMRAKVVAFSKPLYYGGNNVMVKENSSIDNIHDLNTSTTKIAVIQGEYGHMYAQTYLPDAELIVLDAGSDNTAPLLAVAAGQADAGMFTDDVIEDFIDSHSGFRKINTVPYSVTPNAFGVKLSDQKLLNFLNTSIDMLQADGFLVRTARNYNAMFYVEKANYISLYE